MVSEVTKVSSVPDAVSPLPLPVLCLLLFPLKPSTEKSLRWKGYFSLELILETPNMDG